MSRSSGFPAASLLVCVGGLLCSVSPLLIAAPANTAATVLEQPERTQLATLPVRITDFELLNQDAEPVKFSSLQGKPALVFFGFTNCPNVCPAAMQILLQVQRTLHEQDLAVEGVLVSVDGERDTPPVLKKFLAPFGPRFVGLTGDPKVVRGIANEFSAVFFKGMPTDSAGGYNVEHTSQIYLVDRQGQLRATFYNAPVGDVLAVTTSVIREKRQ